MPYDEVQTFVELFSTDGRYYHIEAQQIPAIEIQQFLSQNYVWRNSIDWTMNLFADWCMANQMCDVQC